MSRTPLFRALKRSFRKANSLSVTSTRRDFLRHAGASATLLSPVVQALASTAAHALRSQFSPVHIIGAGAAGLTAAFQLRKARVPFVLIEASHQIGGRIQTQYNFNDDQQFVEIGGELVDTNHYTLRGLAEELGVEIEDFTAFDEGINRALYHYQGQSYFERDVVDQIGELLKRIKHAHSELYEGDPEGSIDANHAARMPKIRKYENISIAEFLDQQSSVAPKWLIEMIKVAYTCENGVDADLQPSIALIDIIDTDPQDSGFELYGASDESKRVKGGNSRLIESLARSLRLNEQNLRLGARLTSVRQKSNGALQICFDQDGRVFEIQAERLLITVPFSVLRDVDGFAQNSRAVLALPPIQLQAIRELGYGMNTKVMTGFQSRFWRTSTPRSAGTLYTDGTPQSFWETSRLQSGQRGILTNFSGGSLAVKIAHLGADFTPQVLNELGQVFGASLVSSQFEARRVALGLWPLSPFVKASYCTPLLGQYSTLWGRHSRPALNHRMFFAGEHTHPLSFGYMNGGFSSGALAADAIMRSLGIKRSHRPRIPGRHLVPRGADNAIN